MSDPVALDLDAARVRAIENNRLPEYDVMPRAFRRMMILGAIATAALVFAILGTPFVAWLGTLTRQDRVFSTLFVLNATYFTVFWLIYFTSGWGYGRDWGDALRTQTLRTLLKSHSRLWLQDEDSEQITYYRDKARSTMTAQAVFIAITVFIINVLSKDSLISGTGGGAPLDRWIAFGALASAACAFTLLLVSTDAADTMYNTFKVREYKAVSSLYGISARLKYYGFVLSFVAVALLTYTMDALVASLTIVLLMLCGYPYWYRDISEGEDYRHERTIFRWSVVIANLVVVALAYFR